MMKLIRDPASHAFAVKPPWRYQMTVLGWLTILRLMEPIAPAVAERIALRLFLTPPKYLVPDWQKHHLSLADQKTIEIDHCTVRYYQWGQGVPIVLVHGWGGRGGQLSAFIEPLVQAGFSVTAIDGPAHGGSSGKRTDMFQFAAAIDAIIKKTGSVQAIIAHSFGAACTLLALKEYKINVGKLILIGSPASAIWVTEKFAENLKISKKTIVGMRRLLEERHGNRWRWEDLSLIQLIKGVSTPILLVHDRDDREVPFADALALKKAVPTAELYASEQQGHRRILRSPEVIARVLAFIKPVS